jgi:CRP-like cAMP-binding protein/predicted metal-dependent hydrolase/bacterioferritin-associated ferredoxin
MSISHDELCLLRSVPILAQLEERDQAEAIRAAQLVMFAEGEEVVRQGDPADAFFVVLDGQIEITQHVEAVREVLLAQLGPGTWFGEQALLSPGARRNATVRALTPLRCAAIAKGAFHTHVYPANRPVFDRAAAENLRNHLLRSLDAFQGLEVSEPLVGAVSHQTLGAGEVVVRQGGPADAVYFVLSGVALVLRGAGDGEVVRIGPGQCFGEVGVLSGNRRSASVIAETPLEVLRIEGDRFRTWYDQHPQLRDFLDTLERVYALGGGRQLSVYRGEVDGRPSISTIYGDAAGDCVVSTRVIGEDVVILVHKSTLAERRETLTFQFPETGAVRELQLANVTVDSAGRVERAKLVGVLAQNIGSDVGALYARVLERAMITKAMLNRFARTGYLGGAADLRDSSVICNCLRLTQQDVLAAAAENGLTLEGVRRAIGIGLVCGACEPSVREVLAKPAPGPSKSDTSGHTPVQITAGPPPPVPRRPEISFDAEALWQISGATLFQFLFAASLFASTGERYMVRHIGKAAARIDDPVLLTHVEAFLEQESNHISLHEPLNRILTEELFPESRSMRRLAAGLIRGSDRLPEGLALSMCAAIECAADAFFSVFFERYFGDGPEAGVVHTDPVMQELAVRSGIVDLFVWHGAEELAHRHVAFEVMRARGTPYPLRALGFVLLLVQVGLLAGPAALSARLRRNRNMVPPTERRRRRHRELTRVVRRFAKFLRPGFHPSDEDYTFLVRLEQEVELYPVA